MSCMSEFSVELKFRVVMDGLLIPRQTRYNKTTHDFYFAESSQSPAGKEDKWEEFLFVIRRRFGLETPKNLFGCGGG